MTLEISYAKRPYRVTSTMRLVAEIEGELGDAMLKDGFAAYLGAAREFLSAGPE